MVSRFCAIALPLLATGCVLGPDYQRPAIDAPASYRYAYKEVQETANAEWWKQFGDPVLDGLIDEALRNNRNVMIAAANVERAAGVLTQARSALFPQLGYGVTGARQRGSEINATPIPPTVPNPQDAYQALASVSWELDLWGRIRRLSESARAQMLATEQARRGVVLSLVAAVATDYLALRGLDEELAIARRTLGAYGESVRLFELQFKYGQISRMEVSQARSQYETAAAQIPQLESQIAQLENALSVLLSRNPGPLARGKSIYELALPVPPAGLPSDLLERRPDLIESEQNLIAANAQIGAARALYFPTISLTGAFGGASQDLSDLFKGPARVWSYAGSIAGPIFTFGLVSGQIAQAEAAQQAALLSYRQSVQNAFADVENALVSSAKISDQLAAQERLVAALRDYSRLARLQYDGGYAPYATVLQAEQQLFPAELQLATTRASMFVSAVALYQATGGGWVDVADAKTISGTARETIDSRATRPPLF
jgi:multidrug efflux system outer membrane protein